jgi:methionine synthase / methylenetetrahydrofolate reductase(NADPH)
VASLAEQLALRMARQALLADGAMGTLLHAAGKPLGGPLPELNLSDAGLIRSVHEGYLNAGADLIQTNTFGAGRLRLESHGLGDLAARINEAGVRIARAAAEATGRPVLVGGSVSPAVTVHQRRRVPAAARVAALREQIGVLAEAGVDVVVLETFGYLDELVEAVEVAASLDVPVIAQATFAADGHTFGGETPREVCVALAGLPILALGTNCTLGPQGVLAVLRQLREHTDLPLTAQPNAGLPRRVVGGRFEYDVNAEYFARHAQSLVAAGASIVGGCCGTTPTHLAAAARLLGEPARSSPREQVRARSRAPATSPAEPSVSTLAPRFAVVAETEPPAAGTVADVLSRAARIQAWGVDRILVAPGAGPRARLGPVALAVHLQNELGIDAIASVTTWDKTIMALQADLLGAHALGVRRVVCETGNPPLLGDYPDVDGVWDVDSVGLVDLLRGLNDGVDCNGLQLAGKTAFEIGVRINPGAKDLEAEALRARRKLDAGAGFVITRPVYELGSVRRLLAAVGQRAGRLLVAVRPLRDAAEAEYLRNEVPDVLIPDATLEALRRAGCNAGAAGIELAIQLVTGSRELADGVVLSLPDDAKQATRLISAARPG